MQRLKTSHYNNRARKQYFATRSFEHNSESIRNNRPVIRCRVKCTVNERHSFSRASSRLLIAAIADTGDVPRCRFRKASRSRRLLRGHLTPWRRVTNARRYNAPPSRIRRQVSDGESRPRLKGANMIPGETALV